MSHVTNIVLFTGGDASEVERFNRAMAKTIGERDYREWVRLQPLAVEALLGPKVFTAGVFAAAWNEFAHWIPSLVDNFRYFDWEDPEAMVLIIDDEQNDVVTLTLKEISDFS
jgi:hypothetical protein